jgi:FlaA1/EpsC-like NDP-sugar epimerase
MEPKWGWVSNHTSPPNVQRLLRDVLIDLAIVAIAYTLAFFLRALTVPLDYQDSIGFILYAAAVQVLALYIFGAYHRLWSRTSGHSVALIVNAVGLATVVVALTDLVPNPHPLPISVVIVAQASSCAA